uniref:Uncharacterized protein n=1 Tax=Setaria italica TaxID=4555 RepID=K3YP19_SETIT
MGVRVLEALIAESPMLEIEDLPSIEEVVITTYDDTDGRDFVKLLTGLARVRKLNLEIQVSRFLYATPDLTFLFVIHTLALWLV